MGGVGVGGLGALPAGVKLTQELVHGHAPSETKRQEDTVPSSEHTQEPTQKRLLQEKRRTSRSSIHTILNVSHGICVEGNIGPSNRRKHDAVATRLVRRLIRRKKRENMRNARDKEQQVHSKASLR